MKLAIENEREKNSLRSHRSTRSQASRRRICGDKDVARENAEV